MTDLLLAENEKIALIQRTLTAMGPRRGFELIPDDGVMSDEEREASWKANERRSSTGLPTLVIFVKLPCPGHQPSRQHDQAHPGYFGLVKHGRINQANQISYRTCVRLYRWNGARSDVGQSDLSARDLCRSRIFRRGQLAGSWADQLSGGPQRFHVRLFRHYHQSCTFTLDLRSRGQSQPPLHCRGHANLPDYWRVSEHGKHPTGIPTTLATFRPPRGMASSLGRGEGAMAPV